MSQISKNNSGGGGGGIETIDGDVGSITGATVTIYADNAANNSGSSVEFVNSGTVSTLNVTDVNSNTLIGKTAGNLTLTGTNNTAVGVGALQNATSGFENVAMGQVALSAVTTGNNNVGLGFSALDATSTGSFNIGIGQFTGDNLNGAEDSNILLNSLGFGNQSNVLAIGQSTGTGAQQLNTAYIQGISSNTQPVTGSIQFVTIDTSGGGSNGLLGVTAVSGGITLNPDTGEGSAVSGSTINIQAFSDPNFPNNCGSSVWFYGDTGTTPQTMLLNVTDASDNTILGINAGSSALVGGANTSIGANNLSSLINGVQNTACGVNSLAFIVNDNHNTAVGAYAAYLLNGASGITAVGSSALTSSVSDSNNTAVGFQTLLNLNGGSGNTSLGTSSLQSSTTDSNNTAIGWNSLLSCNGGEGNTAVGAQSMQNMVAGADNVVIGYETLFSNTSGNYNTALGTFALYSTTTSNNSVAVGYQALYNTQTDNNVAVGYLALQASVSDIQNTAIGWGTLTFLNGGSSNTAVGFQCMNGAGSGSNNTSMGVNAMAGVGTSANNTAIGYGSLANSTAAQNNTSVGYESLLTASTGSNNVALGYQSMNLLTTGLYNTGVGTFTLSQALTGAYNTALGYIAGGNYTGAESYNCCINAQGTVGDASVLRLGDSTGTGFSQFNAAYIQGVYSNTQPVGGTIEIVTIDNMTGQLGVTTTAPGSVTFTGDIGTPFTTNSVTIAGDPTANYAGGSVVFRATSPELRLETTNGNLSTFIGRNCGNNTLFGASTCVAVGYNSQHGAVSGASNCSLGNGSLASLTGGNYNLCLGDQAGAAYGGAESNNILLNCFLNAVGGQNNMLRIGDGTGTGQQQLSTAYICGIANGVLSSGSPTPYLTLTDNSADQVVCPTPVSANTASTTFGSLAVGTALQNTSLYPILVNVSLVVTAATGAVILVGVDNNATPTAQPVTATFSGVGTYHFSFSVPSGYYAEVTTTGTITVGSITTFVTQIG